MSRRTPALALTLTVALAAGAPSALAQSESGAGGKPTPSASALWKKYPLHPTPTATQTVAAGDATPVASRTVTPSPAVGSSNDGSAWSPALIVLIAVVALATVGVWTLVLLRRRRGPAGGRRRRAMPPDPSRPWTAAVDWIQEGDGAHFRVLARAKGEPGTTPILRSAVLPWPPADSGAVDAMTKAVERLELHLLDAGWTPTKPGRAWYEKRFAWTPKPESKPKRPAQPKPAPKSKSAAKPKPGATQNPPGNGKPTAKPSPMARANPLAKGNPLARANPLAKRNPLAKANPLARTKSAGKAGPAVGTKPVAKPKPAAGAKPKSAERPNTAPAPKAKPAASVKPAAKAKSAPKAKPARQAKPAQPKSNGAPPLEAVRRPAPSSQATAAAAAPAAARPAKPPSTWPADAKSLWRCEIRFDAGYSASRFTATVHPPAGSEARSRVIARSESLRWLFMSPPDAKVPEHRNAALALAKALRGAGWEVVGRGGGWYAERYVWRREGDPPARVELPVTQERRGERA